MSFYLGVNLKKNPAKIVEPCLSGRWRRMLVLLCLKQRGATILQPRYRLLCSGWKGSEFCSRVAVVSGVCLLLFPNLGSRRVLCNAPLGTGVVRARQGPLLSFTATLSCSGHLKLCDPTGTCVVSPRPVSLAVPSCSLGSVLALLGALTNLLHLPPGSRNWVKL